MELLVGILIGLVLGLTGAGGSVFAVPLLVLMLGMPAQMSAGLSLGAVGVAALVGVLFRLRKGHIQWLPALVFAVIGSLFSPLGSLISGLLNESALLGSFFILVTIISIRMWRQASRSPEQALAVRAHPSVALDARRAAVCGDNALSLSNFRLPCFVRIASAAILTGTLSGIYGVGGGFVIVPVLSSLLRMDIRQAVSTSLLVISVVSGVGFVAFAARSSVDFSLLSILALGGVGGMFLGFCLSNVISGPVLQKVFAVMMVVLSAVMLMTRFVVTG